MGLDEELVEKAIDLLRMKSPESVNITEIYSYLRKNHQFTERQLQIHKQVAGQEEPHWMHDLRNLLANKKSKGLLVNPKSKHWSLPRDIESEENLDLLFDASIKNAADSDTVVDKSEKFAHVEPPSELYSQHPASTSVNPVTAIPKVAKPDATSRSLISVVA